MSSKPKLTPGRYTKGPYVGEVRYLDPSVGILYEDAEGEQRANSGVTPSGGGVWASCGWEFTEDAPRTVEQEPYGYLVCSPNGPAQLLARTQLEAEAEAMRLAKANVGVEFTITPYTWAPLLQRRTPRNLQLPWSDSDA